MKLRNRPKWILPILGLTISLFYFGDRVSGQGTPRGALDASSDLPAAADRSPDLQVQTLTILRAGNGQGKVKTIPAGSSFKKGTTVTLEVLPDPHSAFEGWRGSCSGSSRTCKILMSTDRTVTATFALKTYTISVRPPVNGVIHPYGTIKAVYGEKRRFQIIPLPGYRISEVLVDKVSQGAINAYTFEEVTADHLVEAIFVKK
jgi:hypothetical protein